MNPGQIDAMEGYFTYYYMQQKPWNSQKKSTGGRELLTAGQIAVVSRHLAETHSDPFEVLVHGKGQAERMMWIEAAVKELIEANCPQFQCPICFDGLDPFSHDQNEIWQASPKKTENWQKQPCEHAFCKSCVRSWCETKISEMQHNIRCPAEGCSYTLWAGDVRALVDSNVFQQYEKQRNANHVGHLEETLKDDAEGGLHAWLRKNARPCPKCKVIVSRSEGCDDMQCVCGCSFCYKCGRKRCKCGKRAKNIWDLHRARAIAG